MQTLITVSTGVLNKGLIKFNPELPQTGSPSFKFLETAKLNLLSRNPTDEQNKLCQKLWNGTFNSDEEVACYIDAMGSFYSYKKRHGEQTNRPTPDYPYAYEPLNQELQEYGKPKV